MSPSRCFILKLAPLSGSEKAMMVAPAKDTMTPVILIQLNLSSAKKQKLNRQTNKIEVLLMIVFELRSVKFRLRL